jgi:hypothetical protein
MEVTTQLSGDSQDWDCFSGMIAKTDLRSVGHSGLSSYTCESC